ncbi:MAG: 3-phosphoglycerate dehydrogenase [Acetobacteraceae bacterium]|nr:3-phosphoglycerate dehydrogenase [Acetobacteraceae bacterium]
MQGLFVDATDELGDILRRVGRADDPAVAVNIQEEVEPEELPGLLAGHDFVLNDRTHMPTEWMARCGGLKHVIFLGTGARSYMNPEELAGLGIAVHTIKGYGDTAVAEHAIALMWAAARGLAAMDGAMRRGQWLRREGRQLTGKTLGLVGFGGIAAEVARIAGGSGMRVLAWNRTPRTAAGVEFVALERLLAESDVVSLHLLLNDETHGFLSAERIARMKPGALLVNTARGAVVDEGAMVAALKSGQIGHAGLDVFCEEPLSEGHPLAGLANVTLSAHSAFMTPEASETLLRRALDIAGRLARGEQARSGR